MTRIPVVVGLCALFLVAAPAEAAVSWHYASPLTVTETITALGGGSYRYEYSFVNVDTSPIWHFGVNTTFVAQGEGGTLFNGHPTWGGPNWNPMTSVFPEYDARNLDPNIVGVADTGTVPWEDPATSIQLSEAASGFSYIASTYDSSPKYYWYETLASGYVKTNGTGKVAAVGLTIPEPGTLSVAILGGLGLIRRRR